jgi:hypothetical protein
MFISVDPTAQPGQIGADRAVEPLKRFAPDAGDEVRAMFSDKVEFFDCGSNWSGVSLSVAKTLRNGGVMPPATLTSLRLKTLAW